MKSVFRVIILCIPAALGVALLFRTSEKQVSTESPDVLTNIELQKHEPDLAATFVPGSDDVNDLLPPNVIPGERVIHFPSREAYLEYLQALSDLGLSPQRRTDALLAIRVSKAVLSRLNPSLYGGQERLSYRVEQPLPPVERDPALFAQLRAFGGSAQAITGNSIGGDGSGVRVAILDSGIEDHPYFDAVAMDSIDLTDRGVSGAGSGHGTAVASIIAGREGIAPMADLLVIRVLDDQGIGRGFDVADGIVRAVDLGAQVINLSLGVYQDTQMLRDAVRYAHAQGVLLVAAAGNDGYEQLPYPAAYPEVLSVTAVDGRGNHALFPNRSRAIDFAAPGVGIVTAAEDEGEQLFSGTSAAAPFVAGTLAALLSAKPAPGPQEATNLLRQYLDEAGPAGTDSLYGGGLLNWDRLRERDTNDVPDVALASIYLPPDAQPGTMMPVEVIVQNQGTGWLTSGALEIQVGDSLLREFTVGAIAPGQVTTRTVHTQVPALHSSETLTVAARVLADDAFGDVRPGNNAKVVLFRPVQR